MSTACKICINSKEEDVCLSMSIYLKNEDDEYLEESSEWPLAIEYSEFNPDESMPSLLSIKQVTEDVTEIHYNSFSKVVDLVSYLSKNLKTKAVVNIYQSTAEACYWAYYLDGEQLREIETGDGEILDDNGIKLDFENDQLGHNISDTGEEPFYIFDTEDMEHYNNSVGINAEIYQKYDSNWKNFKMKFILDELNKKIAATSKAWWKFW